MTSGVTPTDPKYAVDPCGRCGHGKAEHGFSRAYVRPICTHSENRGLSRCGCFGYVGKESISG